MRTPLRYSPWLSQQSRADVYVKIETLQPTFSFKIRGAYNAVLRLTEGSHDGRPLVTASAGNHGRALAHAARDASIPLTVYSPRERAEDQDRRHRCARRGTAILPRLRRG